MNDWTEDKIRKFFAHVDISGECWNFDLLFQGTGYGDFAIYENHKRRHYKAHRYSWVVFLGPIPDGLSVLHCCDNRPCVRPDHLFLGTYKDNYQDARKKGRNTRGEKIGTSKLQSSDIVEIRNRFKGGHGEIAQIAREYGVSWDAVQDIVNGNTWRHVD